MRLSGREWPNQNRVKGERLDPKTWIRLLGTTNVYHLPNSKGRRTVCSVLLPTEQERETIEDPPLGWRCRACQRELERRQAAASSRPWMEPGNDQVESSVEPEELRSNEGVSQSDG